MNAIGYAHFELNGGVRRLLRWVIGFAILAVLAIAIWARTGGGIGAAASAARVPLAITLGVLLVIVVNIRIAGAVKRDVTLDMFRSHRLMPQTPASAVLGYVFGPGLSIFSAAGVVFLAGFVCTLVAGGNPAAWMMICAILFVFAAMTWFLTLAGSFTTKPAKGEKPKGGIGWLPWAIIGPSLGTGGAVLVVVPWVAVLIGPLIGQSVFAVRRPDQITWAHALSGAMQLAFTAIFFIAACRRYRRDDVPAFSVPLWLGVIGLIVVGSVLGIARFEAFRPAIFDDAILIHNVAVPATLTLLLLMLQGPLAVAESQTTVWRHRQLAGDPFADESRPKVPSWAALLLVIAVCAPMALLTPDVEGTFREISAEEAEAISPLSTFAPAVWGRAWSVAAAAFVCGAVFIWSLVHIRHRVGGGRYLFFLAGLLWLGPLIAAGVWAFRQEGHLGHLLGPIAAYSTPGAIWTAWCGTVEDPTGLWDNHLASVSVAALWPGVFFQALLAAAALVAALRVPNRAAVPAMRE